jgi:electron transfer flavoprotein beta subunit
LVRSGDKRNIRRERAVQICVPIKQVPETNAVRMDEQTGTMIRDGVEAIVNPLDLYAIETAIRLARTHEGQVTVVSMGPPKAETALREALSMGCDRAVLLSDKAFAGSDTWATSQVLAGAIRKLGPFDLILCGERATDGDTGQVGPGIAAFLDLPLATYVSRVEDVSADHCRVRRLVETGREILQLETPCVLTVVKEIGEPRLPTLRGKQRARRTEIPTMTAEDLDLDVEQIGLTGSPTRVVKIFRPKVIRQCDTVRVQDDKSLVEAVEKLADFLSQRGLP